MPRYIVWDYAERFKVFESLAAALDWKGAVGGLIYEPLGMSIAHKVFAEKSPSAEPLATSIVSAPPTPTPWTVSWSEGLDWPEVVADGWPVLLPRDAVEPHHKERTLAEALANARLIVTAVGAHADLVAASRNAMHWIEDLRVPQNIHQAGVQVLSGSAVLDALRDAIAKAEEEP